MRRIATLGLLAALLAGPVLLAGGQTPDARPPRFGIVAAYPHAADVSDLGAQWERVTFEWAAFQPGGPADFQAGAVDSAWLLAAQEAGREVVGLIVHTPDWASESGGSGAVPAGLSLPVSDPDNVWAAFVTRLVTHYAPLGVHHWIIYDAPDVRRGEGPVQFEGGVEDYARLVHAASLAAKAADPQAAIHLAGMDWWADMAAGREAYLARLLRVLRADPEAAAHGPAFDVATVRANNGTSAVWDLVAQTRAILDAAGLRAVPIWLYTNASPTLDTGSGVIDPVLGVTPGMQADFIVQAAALGLAAGVERIAVDRLADVPGDLQPWGLVRADGTRRQAFNAYHLVIDLFEPVHTATRYHTAQADLVRLEQGDRTLWVMWARGTVPVQFIITSPEVGEVGREYDSAGRSWPVESQAVEWPAAFVLDVAGARRDDNGFLTVAGSPRILALAARDEFFRVVYVIVDGQWTRLK